MSVIHPGLFFLMRRFPAEKDRLRRFYLGKSVFRSMCVDYQECLNALDYWRHSEDGLAPERCSEYEELQKSLEEEIEDFLGCERGAETDRQGRQD